MEKTEQSTLVPGFSRAEEKAVKAIQKHSMNIKGIQRNSKIDEHIFYLERPVILIAGFFLPWNLLIFCWKITQTRIHT